MLAQSASAQRATPVSSTPDLDRPATVQARFLVVADADPALLSRLLEAFAKLGEVPTRLHASRESGDGSEMTIDLRGDRLAPRTAELIEFGLRRVLGVQQLIAVVEPSRA